MRAMPGASDMVEPMHAVPQGPSWQLWVIAGATVMVGLAGIECILRAVPLPIVEQLRARQSVQERHEEVHPRGLYSLHSAIGWTLTPGFSGRFRHDDFDIDVAANAEGLREETVGVKPAGAYRILGLGDSFAFGWGVERGETFLKVLERRLDEAGVGYTFQVINAGIPGFGTYEALKLLEEVGLGYDPDLVLLAFYEGNDYRNNQEAPRTRIIDDGYLRDVPKQPPSALTRWLTRHSLLYAMAAVQWEHVWAKRAFGDGVAATRRLLREMKMVLDQRHIPLVLVLIPDQDAAVYSRALLLRLYDRLLSGMDLRQARQAMEVECRRDGIGFCRLSARFEDGPEAAGLRLRDTHFNRAGHEAVAQELEAYLRLARLWRS